ncbi:MULTISPECIES: FxSxx-COOH system tetratricopeptide repeat protein [Streptomyces]|uniref:TIR domain-containing protein n=1 Tax=Streptomyces plumbiresistens TaxID=511811 RepID=A0ABP7TN33_9ACTN|nr:FxSxx-COOH system tetratricopeptide repeat protein [Streptomyces sp. NBC_01373]MCX4697534.1 FxSxx-COOH system tetratricopeptide repeat protein [Streptomyces sp. NBC_01373]
MDHRVFISHAGADRAWAEWVAWQLTDAGCTVVLDLWEPSPGEDLRLRAERELSTAQMVVLLLSGGHRTPSQVLSAVGGAAGPVIPVRLDDTPVPPELDGVQAVNLAGVAGPDARERLVRAVTGPSLPAEDSPAAHLTGEGRLRRLGLAGPRLPGSVPRVWNLPQRHPRFTGRDTTLNRLRDRLTQGSPVVVTGMGGVGKTHLALEYAYRFAGEYELAWWVGSEPIAEQLAELALRTGAATAETPPAEAAEALKADLRTRSRWLLVFDDASPEHVAPHLPEGVGHVLLTSRAPHWEGLAAEFAVEPFTRAESVALLRSALPSAAAPELDTLASRLSDLPLALEVAASTLEDERMNVEEYLRLLSASTADAGDQAPYRPFTETVRLTLEQLRESGPPSAVPLLFGWALLATAPFPLDALSGTAAVLPEALADVLPPPDELPEVLSALQRHSLVLVQNGAVLIHRATLSVLRDLLPDLARSEAARVAEALLVSALPDNGDDPARERWTDLLPHLLAVAPGDLVTAEGRSAVCYACRLLMERGEAAAARERLEQLIAGWSGVLGHDDPHSLLAATYLAEALRRTGSEDLARQLLEEVLERRRLVLGEDHPETLTTAALLAVRLGEADDLGGACALGEDTLARMRRVLGEDHRVTLATAANLSVDLRLLGHTHSALRLLEEVLVRRRRVLGEDHPDSLAAAADLAVLQAGLGAKEAARSLAEEVFVRRSRVLGDLHQDTMATAALLITLLTDLGERDAAQDLAAYMSGRSTRTLGTRGVRVPDTPSGLAAWQPPVVTSDDASSLLHRRDVAPAWDLAVGVTRSSPSLADESTAPHPERSAPPQAAWTGESPEVVISHAEADASWAEWAAWNLKESGLRVALSVVHTSEGEPWSPRDEMVSEPGGVVLALVSSSYLAATGLRTPPERARLQLLDALDRGRFVLVLVERTIPEWPPGLRDRLIGPPLAELDEEAARELLRHAVRSPRRPGAERPFPGTSAEPSDETVLQRQLVNALLRSAVMASPNGRGSLLQVIDPLISSRVPRHSAARPDVIGIVRACMDDAGGLRAMVRALEVLDGDSAEVREIGRIVERIERYRETA